MSGPVEAWMISNLVVVALLGGGVLLGIELRRRRLWREAAIELARRRPIALAVIALYVLVALADSVAWVGGIEAGDDVVRAHEARSIVDRIFEGTNERSYSAPLAHRDFYGDKALVRPGGHLLGTDILGTDILYLTLKGARVALLIGGLSSAIAIPIALLAGIAAGYYGGRIDDVVFFVISTLASIPTLLLLIALVMTVGRSTFSVCLALGVTVWVTFCRITRGETLKLRELEYVKAARALGVPDRMILLRHVLPNLSHLVVINFVLLFSSLVLFEAVLSWLGIGVAGSWGQMIDHARDELSREPVIWWNLSAAGAALFGLLLAVNFVGDALRDVLDPHTRREHA